VLVVHAFPSSQEIGVWEQPDPGEQSSKVHAFPSSHIVGGWVHAPLLQMSFVQREASAQSALLVQSGEELAELAEISGHVRWRTSHAFMGVSRFSERHLPVNAETCRPGMHGWGMY